MKYIIEGIDRLGKSTLVKNMLNELGYHQVIHLAKPKIIEKYTKESGDPLQRFQYEQYINYFEMLRAPNLNLIFDRGHLGEAVYSPIYRGYSGDYVFKEEYTVSSDVRLILLTTSDFSFLKDDGGGHNWANKEKEQDRFIDAFNKSTIKNKVLIDVSNGTGGFKSAKTILDLALGEKTVLEKSGAV